ncbi:Rieske 2Fe-2S domain-containing protein [Lentzea sp. NPDC058436]|uniref:Rieske 2Fe-2S domain-containing protein n=1 Tax=Lentzea sp. NPDC058436 TaxID=3346499 RepID=UPI00365834BB
MQKFKSIGSWSKAGLHTGLRDFPAEPVKRPYPNGWFAVCVSAELRPGAVLRRRFMGEEIVVYRTASGVARVVGAYCPHLGAHLGYGGVVDGECVVCPFHKFAFDGSGQCVRSGYGTPPSSKLKLATHEVREVDGIVLVWHHSLGEPPGWEVPDSVPRELRPRFSRTYTLVDIPQDVVENAFDVGHFEHVHHTNIEKYDCSFNGTSVSLSVDLVPNSRNLFGLMSSLHVHFDSEVHGLGFVHSRISVPKLGAVFQTWALPTPVDPLHLDFRVPLAIERMGRRGERVPRWLMRAVGVLALTAFGTDIARDFPIWQNKTYLPHPVLVQGDGPIGRYRRWAGQFYTGDVTDLSLAVAAKERRA